MPIALNLGGLYELLHTLIPLAPRRLEQLTALPERVRKVQALQRELTKTIAKLETEKQFNRKVEINATLKTLRTQLQGLAS